MGTLIHPSFPSLPATSPFVSLKPETIPPSPTTTHTVVKEENAFPQAMKVKEAVPRDQNEEVFPLMKEVFPLTKEVPQAKAAFPQAREVPHNQAKKISPQAKCLAKTTSEHTSNPLLSVNVDEAASVTSSTSLSPQDSNGGIQRSLSSTDSDYYMAESCLNCAELKEKLLKSQESISESQNSLSELHASLSESQKSFTAAQEVIQELDTKLKSAERENQQLKQEKEETLYKLTKLTVSLEVTQSIMSSQHQVQPTVYCNNHFTIQGGHHTFNQTDERREGETSHARPVSEVTQKADDKPVSFPQGCTDGYSLANGSNNPLRSNHHDRDHKSTSVEEGAY